MIKIITLVENTKCVKSCGSKHGLSFYIETKNHKILFDVGPNDLYYKNAKERLDNETAQLNMFDLGYNPYQE